MRAVAKIAGVLFMLMGVVWILQGINVLPGSFMTGQIKWAAYGAIALVLGVLLFLAGRRRNVLSR